VKPLALAFALFAAALVPGTAQASRSAQFASYIVLQDPPSRLPPGAKLLKVRLLGDLPYRREDRRAGARARLLEGPGKGRVVRLVPDSWTSCDGWQNGEGPGYAVAFRCAPGRYEVIGYRSRKWRTPDQDRSAGISGAFRNCRG
jgi:hypothetical protein